MFVFFTSFGGNYGPGNNITLFKWSFTNLKGEKYDPHDGSVGEPEVGKMAWTLVGGQEGFWVPYYFPTEGDNNVNVYVKN